MTRLVSLGWTAFEESVWKNLGNDELLPARVVLQSKNEYEAATLEGVYPARCRGRLLHETMASHDLPVVGDWVALARQQESGYRSIHKVFPRRTRFARRSSGDSWEPQVVASNLDAVLIATSMDRDFNLRRLERYLLLARLSGARPIFILNKSDLCQDPEPVLNEVYAIAEDAPVLLMSALRKEGIGELSNHLLPGQTAVIVGSSGVGKSTLVNSLMGHEVLTTGEIRERDGRGRHTTTRRQLLQLPGGALLIDTPGLRELRLWEGRAALDTVFPDIVNFAGNCRFGDCRHVSEPGCEVLNALEDGRLAAGRYVSYLKLREETDAVDYERDRAKGQIRKGRWKKTSAD